MNITWKISQLDRQTSDGYIFCAHWQCSGVDGEFTGSVYSTCSWQPGTPSIPYDQVTEQEVLEWIWTSGVDKEATEAAVAAKIAEQKAPKVAAGVPW